MGAPNDTTGQAIVVFVTPELSADDATSDQAAANEEVRLDLAKVIRPVAKPRQIILTPEPPKT